MASKEKLKNASEFGRIVAEDDDRLTEYYVAREKFVARAINFEDPTMVFTGPKGIGKSAVLQMVRLERQSESKRIIDISPDDLAFSGLANIEIKSGIIENATRNQWLFTSLWDYILAVEIMRKEFADTNALESVLRKLFGSTDEKQARRLLKSTIGDDGNPRTLTQRMLELIEEIELEIKSSSVTASGTVSLDASKLGRHGQLRLLSQVNHVAKSLPDMLNNEYFVLIDDLDYHWVNNAVQNEFIAALFLSLKKLMKARQLKFVVALRNDILRELPIEDKDKLRDRICQMKWEKADVREMLTERMHKMLAYQKARIWGELFPNDAFDTMWDVTKGLPRELIRLAGICLEIARSHSTQLRVDSEIIREASKRFSEERVEDLASEKRHQVGGLDKLIYRFQGLPKEFSFQSLEEIILRISVEVEQKKGGAQAFSWVGGYLEDAAGFARCLLECGFLQFKPNRTARAGKWDETRDEISGNSWFAIHPMYAPALGLVGD